MALGLYKFYWDCGRSGNLESVFIADAEDVHGLIGKRLYFGEVLGKHSEVEGTCEAGDITLLSADERVVKVFRDHIGSIGHNPFDYNIDDVRMEDLG